MGTDNTQDGTGKKPVVISAQLRGETMAYALQHGLLSLSANLYEPFINQHVQKYFARRTHHHGEFGSYGQNLAGELVGDLSGASALILAEALMPNALHNCTRTMRNWIDPVYKSVAHTVFADERDNPDYEKRVNEWATFQERNLVRSSIMAAAGITGNVLTQKMMKNPAPAKIIFLGKLASSTVTTSLGLGVRLAFPDQLKGLDSWMGKNMFKPMLHDTHPQQGESFTQRVQAATDPLAPAR